jgi:hypothetical protein
LGANIVDTMFGQRDGSLGARMDYGMDTRYVYDGYSYGSAIGLADFNGDGRLDLALLMPSKNMVTVWLGKGDGLLLQTL